MTDKIAACSSARSSVVGKARDATHVAFALAALRTGQRLRPQGLADPGGTGRAASARVDRGPSAPPRGDAPARRPRSRLPRRHASSRRLPWPSWRAASARRSMPIRAPRWRAPCRLPACARRPRPSDLLRGQGELEPGGAAGFARRGCGFDIVSGGELERVLAAGGDPGRSSSPASARPAPRWRERSTPACSASTSKASASSSCSPRSPSGGGRTARVSLRVNPDVDPKTHPYISTGLRGNKFGIAHGEALAAYRARRALPGTRGRRHRLPHRLADHRERALPRCARPPARPGRDARGRRHRHRASRPRRRPRHRLRRRDAARRRRR